MLTSEQLQQIKAKFDEQFDDEEKKQILETLTGSEEKPASEGDEANRFLLSKIMGEDLNQQREDAAVNSLVKLIEGK